MSDASPKTNSPFNKPDWFAIGGVVVTIGLHLMLQVNGPNVLFIFAASTFWSGFVFVQAWRDRNAFRRWGFRADNLVRASFAPAAIFIVSAIVIGAVAIRQGTFWFPANNFWLLLLYPIWGIAQQFLTLGVVVQNLERIAALFGRKWLIVLIGATLFAAVHFPDRYAMLATFALELAIVPLYLRDRNLWPLGIIHGWLGVLFYVWLFGRDLWQDNFG